MNDLSPERLAAYQAVIDEAAPSESDPRRESPQTEWSAVKRLAAEFEELGAEPCSECGYSLNEIRDYVHIVVAAKELVRANDEALGFDRPRPDIAWRNLKAAVATLSSSKETT